MNMAESGITAKVNLHDTIKANTWQKKNVDIRGREKRSRFGDYSRYVVFL
uniref:Uncharacterized protein n=1 Tax=Cucumis melo TaxID=3656 RepID=A0A9I9E9M4_CUCME